MLPWQRTILATISSYLLATIPTICIAWGVFILLFFLINQGCTLSIALTALSIDAAMFIGGFVFAVLSRPKIIILVFLSIGMAVSFAPVWSDITAGGVNDIIVYVVLSLLLATTGGIVANMLRFHARFWSSMKTRNALVAFLSVAVSILGVIGVSVTNVVFTTDESTGQLLVVVGVVGYIFSIVLLARMYSN